MPIKEINKIFFSTVLPQFWYFYCMKVCCLWRKVEVPVYLLMDWQTFGVYSAGTVERRWRWRDRSCSFFKNANNRKINDWRTECFKTEATTECRRSHGFAFHPLRASRSSPSGILWSTLAGRASTFAWRRAFSSLRKRRVRHPSQQWWHPFKHFCQSCNCQETRMQRFSLRPKRTGRHILMNL